MLCPTLPEGLYEIILNFKLIFFKMRFFEISILNTYVSPNVRSRELEEVSFDWKFYPILFYHWGGGLHFNNVEPSYMHVHTHIHTYIYSDLKFSRTILVAEFLQKADKMGLYFQICIHPQLNIP